MVNYFMGNGGASELPHSSTALRAGFLAQKAAREMGHSASRDASLRLKNGSGQHDARSEPLPMHNQHDPESTVGRRAMAYNCAHAWGLTLARDSVHMRFNRPEPDRRFWIVLVVH